MSEAEHVPYEAPPKPKRNRNIHLSDDEKFDEFVKSLPAPAREKFKALRADGMRRLGEDEAARQEKVRLDKERDGYTSELFTRENQERFGALETAEGNERKAFCREKIQELTDAIRELDDRRPVAEYDYRQATKFLKDNMTRTFRAVVPDQAIPDDIGAELETVRTKIDRLYGKILVAEKTLPPASIIKQRALLALQSIATAPNIAGIRTRKGNGNRIKFPYVLVGDRNEEVPDAVALLAWLFPDELHAKICERIDQLQRGSMADDALSETLAALNAELLTLERREEFLTTTGKRAGLNIARSQRLSPLAVLEIEFAQ